ncbi:MAG: hypothetical protein CEE38_12640 [Planctomycetes bacterium B3_Pla]|nr:MAG: hypothetical protein CEE38_12640 [Planctomycetes bacterium B3_Pla]
MIMKRRLFCKILLVVVAVFSLLALSGVLFAQGRSEDAFERVIEIQEKNSHRLMAIEGVEGTGTGLGQSGRPAIKVFTAEPGVAGIPQELDGVPVQTVVTGKFYALKKPPWAGGPGGGEEEEPTDPTDRFPRPVPIGVSTGNEGECSAGTIGCRVTDGADVYALSNNHVFALEDTASIPSLVLQPGRFDVVPQCVIDPLDSIGTLFDYEPIAFDGSPNTIDAAIALSDESWLDKATPSDGYGTPKSTIATAYVNQRVQKYGRTTRLTKGQVWATNVEMDVIYSSGTAHFVDQIMVVDMSGGFILSGDSGSLLVSDGRGKSKGQPVGLLFAGDEAGIFGLANRIDLVLDRFNVTIDGK